MPETDLKAKRPRVARNAGLDEVLATWVLQCQAKRVAVTGELIKTKAKALAARLGLSEDQSNYSNGWLRRFQERNGLKCFRVHGESGSADQDSLDAALPSLRETIAGYDKRDVFNMDETGERTRIRLPYLCIVCMC